MQITSAFVLIALLALKSTSVVAAPIDAVALHARSLQLADLALDLEARGFDTDAFLDAREYEELEARDPTTAVPTTGSQSLSVNTKAPLTPLTPGSTPATPLTPGLTSAASTSEFPSHYHHGERLTNFDNSEFGHGGLGHRRHSFDEAFSTRRHSFDEAATRPHHRLSESDPNFLPHHSLRRAASLSATDPTSLSTPHQMTRAEKRREKNLAKKLEHERNHEAKVRAKEQRHEAKVRASELKHEAKVRASEQRHEAKVRASEQRQEAKVRASQHERLEKEKAKALLADAKHPSHGLNAATEPTVGAKAVQPDTTHIHNSQTVTPPTAHGTNLLATPGSIQQRHPLASANLQTNVDAKSTVHPLNAVHADSLGPITNRPSYAAVAARSSRVGRN